MGVGESGFSCWGVRGPALVLFLFYVNISGMRLPGLSSMLLLFYTNVSGMHRLFHLFSQPLTIPVPLVLLRVRWSIPLVPPWVTASRVLVGNSEAELKLNLLLDPLIIPIYYFLSIVNITVVVTRTDTSKPNYNTSPYIIQHN